MELKQELDGSKLTVFIIGDLNTNTAPELKALLDENLETVDNLVLDLSEMEYISSAGLRVLLSTQKEMNMKFGEMTVRGVNEFVMEIFEDTGFLYILTIEK